MDSVVDNTLNVVDAVVDNTINALNVDDCVVYESERNIYSKADVLKVVELDLDLKMVYAKYQATEELNGHEQLIVAKALVKYLLNQNLNRELDVKYFKSMATAVVETFPTEQELSYIVPAAKKKIAKGKLYDAYNHLRSKLAKVKLISRRTKVFASEVGILESQPETRGEIDKEIGEIPDSETEIEKIVKILRNSADPEGLQLLWEKTAQWRYDSLKDVDLVTYMQSYPCLLTNSGFQLFSIDVKNLYPFISPFENLPAGFSKKVIEEVIKLNKGKKNEILFDLIRNYTDAASQDILSLMVLPILFPTMFISRDRERRRTTKAEIISNFVPYFETQAERETFNLKLTTHTKRAHPTIHIIGAFPTPVVLMSVLNKEYTISHPIVAFQACFFFIFCIEPGVSH